MKAITLRNVPRKVAQAIQRKAKRERLSLNRAVVGLLEEATAGARAQPGGKRKLHYDLDKFAGVWTRREAREFDAALKSMRRVHRKDWE